MHKVKATFSLSTEIADLINIVARQHKMKKSALVEQALREYLPTFTTEADKMERFHELVDKRLDGKLSPSEHAELQGLEAVFDATDAAVMAPWNEQNSSQESKQALSIAQLNKIGKKLDELLHQFEENGQSQEQS
jgi:predicted transcriptional regulator